jgi:tRNA A58 N-methylase Trm61
MHVIILELIKNKLLPGKKILEIGSGTGFLCCCMSFFVGNDGKVFVSFFLKNNLFN